MAAPQIRALVLDTSEAQSYAQALRAAPEIAMQELGASLEEAAMLYTREVKEATPVGVTGLLRGSVDSVRDDAPYDPRIKVFSPLNYAAPVELGTRPHYPPLEPLQDWVRKRLVVAEEEVEGVARAIQRKIGARGTQPRGMFGETFDRLQGQMAEIVLAGVRRVWARIGKA
jgi:hypothetical protein